MNKVTQYLNEHILGEVVSTDSVLERFSRDGGVLQITPDLVAHPRVTNDIRKVARFTWQLAEKGHVMPVVARGGGSDQSGASIGKGVIINTIAHLNNVLYVNDNPKDLFVHAQPGVNLKTLNETLKFQQMTIPTCNVACDCGSIGGAVANNLSGSNGQIGDSVKRLEVVLANGDLIETTRINKRELNKKKGLQTFEGELYRKIDGIIEDNQSLIKSKVAKRLGDNVGYGGIAKVKDKDGSFDLTPLFVGSQGTLGIISEVVLEAALGDSEESVMVVTFDNVEIAIRAADSIATLKPAILELFDDKLFKRSKSLGKQYVFASDDKMPKNILYISFNDYNEKARSHKIKKVLKVLSKLETKIDVFTSNDYPIEELQMIYDVNATAFQPKNKDESLPNLIDGASIPASQRGEFVKNLEELAKKHHIELPVRINWLNGIVSARPSLKLRNVGDKQKVFKIIGDYLKLVMDHDGLMVADSAEGRLKATSAYAQLDEAVVDLYQQIREVFDPFGTLNPGVKQSGDLLQLASNLNSNYNLADFAKYSPR